MKKAAKIKLGEQILELWEKVELVTPTNDKEAKRLAAWCGATKDLLFALGFDWDEETCQYKLRGRTK